MTSTSNDGRLAAAFYPYGSARSAGPAPETLRLRLDLGSAGVVARDARAGVERYFLSRTAGYWLLHSSLGSEAPLVLARVHAARLPPEPAEAAVELMLELWSLRRPQRLRFTGTRDHGALGAGPWARIAMALQPALEDALRAEGHRVHSARGPVGTEEHVLLFERRAHPPAAPRRA